jgi:imidazoleglycerol phosphate synthase glutamine amidotransferase subunit HisH
MIGVIDYGLGNTSSVIRMIEKVGGAAKLVSTPEQVGDVNKLILPGVGHFQHGIDLLKIWYSLYCCKATQCVWSANGTCPCVTRVD